MINDGCEDNATAANIPDASVVGDVADHIYHQAITSAGAGCMAVLGVKYYLNSL